MNFRSSPKAAEAKLPGLRLMKVVEERAGNPVTLFTMCKNPDMSHEFVKAWGGFEAVCPSTALEWFMGPTP